MLTKIGTLVLFIGFCIAAFANPMPVPMPILSELAYDANNRWTVEIFYSSGPGYFAEDYDSLVLAASSGSSRIHLENLSSGTKLFVITSDSLYRPLDIKRTGDSLCLICYSKRTSQPAKDFFFFGNITGSQLDTLPHGYSYARIVPWSFYMDKSPTIGAVNDTVGMMGTLYGKIYDKQNNLIRTGDYFFGINKVYLFGDGRFSARFLSYHFNLSGIYCSSGSNTYNYRITPLEMKMAPDSAVNKDIKILDELQGVEQDALQPLKHEITVSNYPNPFNATTNFRVTLPQKMENTESVISICNASGSKVAEIKVKGSGTVTWDSRGSNGSVLASGVYYYQFIHQNRPLSSGSMILLK